MDMPVEEYEESPITFDWVLNEIEELKKTEWYFARIFELYILEDCNLTKLSKRTTIPINSVSRDVNRVRRYLNQKRKKLLEDGV
jgi:DNA-directed RNA polymerase specialized sigma24 family protein